MADITKCANWHDCPMADDCYRCTAPDSDWQSWGRFYPETPEVCFYMRDTNNSNKSDKLEK